MGWGQCQHSHHDFRKERWTAVAESNRGPYACTVRACDHELGHNHKAKRAHVIPRHLGNLVVAQGRNTAGKHTLK